MCADNTSLANKKDYVWVVFQHYLKQISLPIPNTE